MMPPTLRPAELRDRSLLTDFLNSLGHIHRHLDWRDTQEWLGRKPFYLLEDDDDDLIAALACPPEPKEIAWIRLFGTIMRSSPDRAWRKLFGRALEDLQDLPQTPAVVSLAMRDWYEDLLRRNGFVHHQDIVVFMYDDAPPPPVALDPKYVLRAMTPDDLPVVGVIDNLAFEPIWRLSPDDLVFAMKKSSYSTVVECEGQIIAYQMSSSTAMYAHLARLAVHPSLQRQRIGYALVQNLIQHFLTEENAWGVTLNTQNDNASSLALYQRIGFHETGERFPVFVYPI